MTSPSSPSASDADRLRRALAIFRESLAVPAADRSAFVRDQCRSDAALEKEVLGLLDEETRVDDLLMPGGGIGLLAGIMTSGPVEESDEIIELPVLSAHYRLIKEIGRGGMGVVWLAEQSSPKRLVAVKVIRRSTSGKRLWKRFAYEAEVLGRLHHPGIAQVFEAGIVDATHADEAYIVMEYVDGRSPIDYAQKAGLDDRKKLELAAQMADAVQHAHQRGVIHRDLKPSNMLCDAEGRVKILDFGVARVVGHDHDLTSMHTRAGQIVGTLSYMSPEQVAGEPDDVDTRADVYSLGVVLYQLLAGRLPHELATKTMPEAARILRDEEPKRLGQIDRRFRGDVETIVARAMQKNPDRRYASATDFAEDIRRHLAGLPIVAREDSVVYVIAKELRRHRTASVAALIVLVAIVVFAIYAGIQAERYETIAKREHDAVKNLEVAKSGETAAKNAAAEQAENLRRSLYFSRIGYSLAALAANDAAVVRRELAQCPEDLRRWEWRRLMRVSDDSVKTLRIAADGPLRLAAPANARFAAVSAGKQTCAVIDLTKIEVIAREDVAGSRWDTVWAPRARVLTARSGRDTGVRFDTAAGTKRDLSADEARRLMVLAQGGGDRAFVRYINDRAGMLDTATLSQIAPVEIDGRPECAAFDFTEKRLAVGGSRGVIWIVDPETGKVLDREKIAETEILHVAYSMDGTRIALTTDEDLYVRIIDAEDLSEKRRFLAGPTRATALAFTPDGGRIVLGMRDSSIRVLDVKTGEERTVLHGHENAVTFVGFPDGKEPLVSIAWDATVRRWRSLDETDPTVQKIGMQIFSPAVIDQGRRLLAHASEQRIVELDPATGALVSSFSTGVPMSRGFAASEAERILAFGDMKGVIRLIRVGERSPYAEYAAHGDSVASIAVSPDGRHFASSGEDRTLTVAPIDHPEAARRFGPFERPVAMRMLAFVDDKRIAGATPDGAVQMMSAETGEVLLRWDPALGAVWNVVVSPNHRWIVVATMDGAIAAIDVDHPEEKRILRGHKNQVFGLAFSPAGDRLASGGADNLVRLWEFPGGQEILKLDGHRSTVLSVVFSNDGKSLLSADMDGEVRVWRD